MAVRLALFRVRYVCSGVLGTRLVWAPDERSAVESLREHPSMFGLPHERVPVAHAAPLTIGKAHERRRAA
jgi:hypothetical protein